MGGSRVGCKLGGLILFNMFYGWINFSTVYLVILVVNCVGDSFYKCLNPLQNYTFLFVSFHISRNIFSEWRAQFHIVGEMSNFYDARKMFVIKFTHNV